MLLGLVTPTTGTATVAGRRYRGLQDTVRHVGAVLDVPLRHVGAALESDSLAATPSLRFAARISRFSGRVDSAAVERISTMPPMRLPTWR